MARVTSGHSVFDQASDRFTVKTGYSPVDGTKPSVKDRFRMGRSGTPNPRLSFPRVPQTGPSVVPLLGTEAIVNAPNALTQLVQNPGGLQHKAAGFHRTSKPRHLSSILAPSKAASNLPETHMTNLWSSGHFIEQVLLWTFVGRHYD